MTQNREGPNHASVSSDSERDRDIGGKVLWLALGVIVGWGIFGESKKQAAFDRAVMIVHECEASGRPNSSSKVGDCLKARIQNNERASE